MERLAPRGLQRFVSSLFLPALIPFACLALAGVWRCRLEGARETRRLYLQLRHEHHGPLLVCGNHLTLADSFFIAWALRPAHAYMLRPWELPWNTPERRYFATSPWRRVALYIFKCLPIERGGRRADVWKVLNDFRDLVAAGHVGMIFPEGGRSATGRVARSQAAYGVGRIVASLPGCRVVCVYMRGRSQRGPSILPARGERLRVRLSLLEPRSTRRGLRRSMDFADQIVERLAQMEGECLRASEGERIAS